MKKLFLVSFAAFDGRIHRILECKPSLGCLNFDAVDDHLARRFVADKPPRDFLRGSLKLRLDQSQDVAPRAEDLADLGQYLSQRDEGNVDHNERRNFFEQGRIEIAEIRAFDEVDARVFGQCVIQEAVSDVNRPNGFGAGLKQAVRKAAGRGPHIQTDEPLHRDFEVIQRPLELSAPSGDEWTRPAVS